VRLLLRLGHEAYGIFALGASIAGILHMLEVGITGAAVKYIAEWRTQGRSDRLQTLWITGQTLLFTFGLAGATLQILIARNAGEWFQISSAKLESSILVITWFGLSLLWHLPAMLAKSYLEGIQRYDLSNAADVILATLTTAVIIVFLYLGYGIVAAAMIQSLSYLLYYFVLVWMVHRELPELKFGFHYLDRHVLHEIKDWSFWNFLRNLASRISWDLDSLIIALFLSARSVSPYVIGRKLPYIFSAVSWRWVEVFLPLSSHLQAGGRQNELTAIFLKASRYCLAISLCAAIPLFVFAEQLLVLWLGAAPAQSVIIQQLITISILLDLSHAVSVTLLAGVGKIKQVSIYFLIESLFNLILTMLLVPRIGISGAAIATLVSSAFCVVLLQIPFGCRSFSISFGQYVQDILRPQVVPTLSAILVAALIVRLTDSALATIVGGIACTTLVFAALFWWTGLSSMERSQAARSIQKLLC
jgi:O-antigen/teichoic acid export membrane protein